MDISDTFLNTFLMWQALQRASERGALPPLDHATTEAAIMVVRVHTRPMH